MRPCSRHVRAWPSSRPIAAATRSLPIHAEEPIAGRDVDTDARRRLQRTAEDLLQSALQRTRKRGRESFREDSAATKSSRPLYFWRGDRGDGRSHRGACWRPRLCPAFDPNVFVRDNIATGPDLLADRSTPLFDRVCRMAIPPGSTFKTRHGRGPVGVGRGQPGGIVLLPGLSAPARSAAMRAIRPPRVGHGEVVLTPWP